MNAKNINTLDIRHFVCPMTSVHLRLALDQQSNGAILRVLLRGNTTLQNVRTMLATLHQEILKSGPVSTLDEKIENVAPEDFFLVIKKNSRPNT